MSFSKGDKIRTTTNVYATRKGDLVGSRGRSLKPSTEGRVLGQSGLYSWECEFILDLSAEGDEEGVLFFATVPKSFLDEV